MYLLDKGLMYLLGLANEGEACELDVLKDAMKHEGINQRGWRLFVEYGDLPWSPFRKYIWKKPTRKAAAMEAIHWMRLLQACEMDVLPPLRLSYAVNQWPLPGKTLADIPPLFFRAVWKAVLGKEYAEENYRAFLAEDVLFLANWYLLKGGKDKVSSAQLKGGWESIWRVYEEDILRPENADQFEWQNWITLVEHDGYVFSALNSPAALFQEGVEMEHCIADYSHRCRIGKYRVYAVMDKKSQQKVATLTVRLKAQGIWQLAEIHGPQNDEVSDRVLQASDAVCRSLNDLYRMSGWIRSSMRKQMKPSSA